MKCSICIATHDKPKHLKIVLQSIFRQPITDSGMIEVIVVDDRGADSWNKLVCDDFPVKYVRLDGPLGYVNPAKARNIAYRMARGEVIIAQSDDTVHITENCIEQLIEGLEPEHFLIANVFNVDFSGNIVPGNLDNPSYNPLTEYTGPSNPRPFFFLGSLYRKDLYAIGGNDEEFIAPGREDQWFADCLMHGLGLHPVFSTGVIGHHLQHKHQATQEVCAPSWALYKQKRLAAELGKIPWCSSGGSWQYES